MYDMDEMNFMIQMMRDELVHNGFQELRTPEAVDEALAVQEGSTLLMINSVCGCAAAAARPGVVLSLEGETLPDRLLTVFAGPDADATAQARSYFASLPASSPSAALFKNGELVFFMPRHEIESCTAEQVAAKFQAAYESYLA